MKRTEKAFKQQSASPTPALTPTQFLNRNPIYKKANGEFIARKFRLEFERLTSVHPACKRNTHQPFSASKKSPLINTTSAKRPRKRRTGEFKSIIPSIAINLFLFPRPGFLSYTQMRKEREEYRKCLVRLIMGNAADPADDGTFPNAEELKLLRYYHYIRHGIDTIHVAPLSSKVLQK